MRPYLSVVIPTYNRCAKLAITLQRLARQSLAPAAYEIWVVDDGSTDGTAEFLKEWTEKDPRAHVLHQKNAGQGVARNHALEHVTGEIVLFIGDDIYPTGDFLEKHVAFHQENPEDNKACLGLTEWDPSQPITPFMRWLTGKRGPQFAYYLLKANEEASFWFFYTSNVSLKAILLKNENFDEDFKGYGFEDTELAYRLTQKKHLRLIFRPEALAHHDHFMSEEGLERKMKSIGQSALLFQQKHPEVPVIPRGGKGLLQELLGSLPSVFLLSLLRNIPWTPFKSLYWYALSKRYFFQGLKRKSKTL